MRVLIFMLLVMPIVLIGENKTKKILDKLDEKILERDLYYKIRENRISSLITISKKTINKESLYPIYKALSKEYQPYSSDSALFYSNKCVELAKDSYSNISIVEAKLLQANSLIQLGLYEETNFILKSLDVKKLSRVELINYFIAKVSLNRFKSVYLPKIGLFKDYNLCRQHYQDSLLFILDSNNPKYKVTLADRKKDIRDYESMKNIMLESLSKLSVNDRAYGYTAYTLADAYGMLGNNDKKIKYLALSSISDIVNGVRENSAIRELALLLFNEGDIAHSNKYIQVAFEDAIYSNAKLRSHEVLQILPFINDKHEEIRNRVSKNKTIFSTISIIFTLVLGFAIFYILKQKRVLQKSVKKNEFVNNQLFELNKVLEGNNKKISSYNATLKQLNKGKEDYIAHYLKLSSSYIRKIDDYRKMLYKKAQNDSKTELIKVLRSNELVNKELKSFYKDFDKSFIELYPNFVRDFNLLLKEDRQIRLKRSEMLNTELRVFALIRLGITESTQIAKFLRYSVTTIYNYRTKLRNNSQFSKKEFNNRVENIGS